MSKDRLTDQPIVPSETVRVVANAINKLWENPEPVDTQTVTAEILLTPPPAVTITFTRGRPVHLDGFTIGNKGHYRVVVDERLDDDSRIFSYFHALGHIAKGHLGYNEKVLLESRDKTKLSPEEAAQDEEANQWVISTVESKVTENLLATGIKSAVLNKARSFRQ